MKKTNKKIIFCLLAATLGTTPAVALTANEIAAHITHQAAAAQTQANAQKPTKDIPRFSDEQLAGIKKALPDVVEDQQIEASKVGSHLYALTEYYMVNQKASAILSEKLEQKNKTLDREWTQRDYWDVVKQVNDTLGYIELNNEENRAIYFSLYQGLPEKYTKELLSFEQYNQKYPVSDWDVFREAATEAQRLIYISLCGDPIHEINDDLRPYMAKWWRQKLGLHEDKPATLAKHLPRLAEAWAVPNGEVGANLKDFLEYALEKNKGDEIYQAELDKAVAQKKEALQKEELTQDEYIQVAVSISTEIVPVELTNEENRAIYVTLHNLLPADYRVGILSFEQYSKKYPVSDWQAFHKAEQEVKELVYERVAEVIAPY